MFKSCLIFAVICGAAASAHAQSAAEWKKLREAMVESEIVAAGVKNPRVIESMKRTPRHEFVPLIERKHSYLDMALPIGNEQTISPPFIVAYMTAALDPQPSDKVLEIGTGSGYQAAVLSPLVREVYSIEIVAPLGRKAERTLKKLKYQNVYTKVGDGYLGWPEAAPFDKIIVTCSPENIPQPLVDQLAEGGLMVVPVGERYQQNLYLVRKRDGELEREPLEATFFVPMTGEAERQREVLPDPTRPTLFNGSFEEPLTDEPDALPNGWHYARQATLVRDAKETPEGERFLRFKNTTPGRACQVLQGFPVDGRKVSWLQVSLRAKGQELRFGRSHQEWPAVVVTFYDERRVAIAEEALPPFTGSFSWEKRSANIAVPLKARDAILRVGLLGGIGTLEIDDLAISPSSAFPNGPQRRNPNPPGR